METVVVLVAAASTALELRVKMKEAQSASSHIGSDYLMQAAVSRVPKIWLLVLGPTGANLKLLNSFPPPPPPTRKQINARPKVANINLCPTPYRVGQVGRTGSCFTHMPLVK